MNADKEKKRKSMSFASMLQVRNIEIARSALGPEDDP